MGDTYNITELMIQDHNKTIHCLNKLEKNLGSNIELVTELFDNFKWELEKHLFVEEKAIFTFFNPKSSEEYKEIPYLLDEHIIILDMLKKLESKIGYEDVDFSKLKEALKHHRDFEETALYPKLDRNLNANQKKIIIDRIKQFTC